MDPTASIRKLGFRRWYERQLILCHAALVTCLLCGILIAALMEELNMSVGWQHAYVIAIVVSAAALGLYSWRRYITVLERAERYGERSTCPECKTYARFDILSTGLDEAAPAALAVAPLEAAWLRVQCRKCGTAWRMPD
jgi:hypothetical protein